jgi:signal transduction histidine kinase/ActR/RegA family two-component response regulator
MKTILITLVAMLGVGATIAGPLGPGAREGTLGAFDPAAAALPAVLPILAPGTVEAVSPAARTGGTLVAGTIGAQPGLPQPPLGLLLAIAGAAGILSVLVTRDGAWRIVSRLATLTTAAATLAYGRRVAVDPTSPEATHEDQERHAAATRAMAAVGRDLTEHLDLARVTNRIAAAVLDLFNARLVTVCQLEAAGAGLVCVAAAGALDPARWDGRRLPRGAGVAGLVLDPDRSVPADSADPTLTVLEWMRETLRDASPGAIRALPLRVRGETVGILALAFEADTALSDEEAQLLSVFSDQAATAIEHARLREEAERGRSSAEALAEVGRLLSQSPDAHVVEQCIVDKSRSLLAARASVLYRLDAETGDLISVAVSGDSGGRSGPDACLPAGPGVARVAVLARHGFVSADVLADPQVFLPLDLRAATEASGCRAALAVPLMAQGRVIGALAVGDGAGRAFGVDDIRAARVLADQAAVAMVNMRLQVETQARLTASTRLAEQLRRRQGRLECLLALDADLSRPQPGNSVLARIAEASGQIFDASSALLQLVVNEEMIPQCRWGETIDDTRSPRLKMGEELAATAAAIGEVLVIDTAARDLLAVPLKAGDRVASVLTIWTRNKGGFSAEDVEMARLLARQAGIALENGRLDHQTHAALEQPIGSRKELVQEQKIEAVGLLAGRVAHDFNNILTVVRGRTQLLLTRLPAGSPERRDIELIEQAVERAGGLTRQLLALSPRRPPRREPLDLNALITGAVPTLQRLVGRGITLVLEPAEEPGRALADAGLLEQVLASLVANARDSMPDGGSVTIATGNLDLKTPRSHAQGEIPAGRYGTLSVEDTGVGMDAATLARISEPFSTGSEGGTGGGLGLSIAHGIVRRGGWHLGVDSTVGLGSRFTLYLPCTAAATDIPRESATPTGPRGRETVLLVEDDFEVLGLASDILRARGYAVLESGDPRDAARLAERHRGTINLLVTDMVMPGLAGPALARRVSSSHPETRRLYISGYPDAAERLAEGGSPAGPFLPKPFTPELLARAVRDALDATEPAAAV